MNIYHIWKLIKGSSFYWEGGRGDLTEDVMLDLV